MKKRARYMTKPTGRKPMRDRAILLKEKEAPNKEGWLVDVTWRGANTPSGRGHKTFPNWRHAEEFAAKENKRLDEIKEKGAGRYRFNDAVDSYIKWCEQRVRAKDIGPDSLDHRRRISENHLKPKFGHMRLEAIKKRDVDDWVLDMAGSGTAHSTISDRIMWFKMILSHAVEREMIRVFPPGVSEVKAPGKPLKRASIPDRSDLETLRQYLIQPRPLKNLRLKWSGLRVLVLLGASCGMRAGEVSALRWDSIDPDKCEIEIKEAVARLAGRKGPKSEAGYRKVPLTPRAVDIIEEHAVIYKHLEGKLVGPVLKSRDKDYLHPHTVCEWFNEVMHECGLVKPGKKPGSTIPKFSFHALRHWCASHWMKSTADVHQVAKWLGHKNASMTLDVYGHCLDDPEAREKFLKMPDWLNPAVEIDAPSPVRPIEIMEAPALPAPKEPPLESEVELNGNASADDCPVDIPNIAKPFVRPFIMFLVQGMTPPEAYRAIAPQVIVHGKRPSKSTSHYVLSELKRLKLPNADVIAARLRDEKILKLHAEKHQALDIAQKVGVCAVTVRRVLNSRHKGNANNPLNRKIFNPRPNAREPQPGHKEQLKLL